MCSLYGMGMRYLDGLNRTFYTCVDIEMYCDCNAAYQCFRGFHRLLKGHTSCSWWNITQVQIPKFSTAKNGALNCPILAGVGMFGTLCTESVSKSDVMTVTKMAPYSHPIPLTVGTFQIAKVRNDDSHRDSAHSWPLPQPTFPYTRLYREHYT